jgi:hypothetical protein
LRKSLPATPNSFTVFPVDWRQGDFSRLLDPANGAIQLYNPFSADANGNRVPFPNNQVPLNLFSPAVKKLFSDPALYPLPLSSALRFNQFDNVGSQVNSDQGDIKVDWKIDTKDDFTGRYSNGRQDNPTLHSFPLVYDGFALAPFFNGVLNWTHTFSPSLVNEARAGINYIAPNTGGADRGLGNIGQNLGIAGSTQGLLALGSGIGGNFTYVSGIGTANDGTQNLFANTTWHYADNFTIIRGRHMIKTGAQFMRQWANVFLCRQQWPDRLHFLRRAVHAGAKRELADVEGSSGSGFCSGFT